MGTRIAWLLNLDAELELAAPRGYRPAPDMAARIGALRPRLSVLLAAGDRVIGLDGELEGCEETLAFCPTPSALRRIRAASRPPPEAPPLALLARVNGRAFCAALGQTLPGAAYVRSMDELSALLASGAAEAWLLKREYAFAGRERRRAYGRALDASTEGFARRSFARGEGLQVEPLVARTRDVARHGYVLPSGDVLLGPPMLQQCDARGTWQHSEPLPGGVLTDDEHGLLEASAREAGEALAVAGYFGPFGVDGYRYVDARGAPQFQPRSELNARFSMGYPRALLERALGVARPSRAHHRP